MAARHCGGRRRRVTRLHRSGGAARAAGGSGDTPAGHTGGVVADFPPAGLIRDAASPLRPLLPPARSWRLPARRCARGPQATDRLTPTSGGPTAASSPAGASISSRPRISSSPRSSSYGPEPGPGLVYGAAVAHGRRSRSAGPSMPVTGTVFRRACHFRRFRPRTSRPGRRRAPSRRRAASAARCATGSMQ